MVGSSTGGYHSTLPTGTGTTFLYRTLPTQSSRTTAKMGSIRMQILSLSGKTRFEDVMTGATVKGLRALVSDREGVPEDLIRLTSAGRDLGDMTLVTELNAPIRVLLRLLGGKGGFGAMLRTAGARGVKTTNFDACRDLNGRRLRHVNSEVCAMPSRIHYILNHLTSLHQVTLSLRVVR